MANSLEAFNDRFVLPVKEDGGDFQKDEIFEATFTVVKTDASLTQSKRNRYIHLLEGGILGNTLHPSPTQRSQFYYYRGVRYFLDGYMKRSYEMLSICKQELPADQHLALAFVHSLLTVVATYRERNITAFYSAMGVEHALQRIQGGPSGHFSDSPCYESFVPAPIYIAPWEAPES